MRSRDRVAAGIVAASLALAGCASGGPEPTGAAPATADSSAAAATAAAREAARAFIDRYVDDDGRVVRTDQGGDTVGEAQSYGLLLAQVAGDADAARRIWAWTDRNLRRPDGLLNHRWVDGRVADDDSAADADLVTAWALLRSGDEAMRRHGAALARSLAATSVVDTADGPLLAAGSWATGEPASLNPSYWAPTILRDLTARTGDRAWEAMADAAVATTGRLTAGGTELPPDWARSDGGQVSATPAPDGAVPEVRYSLDAQRVVIWFALDEQGGDELAAGWHELLDRPEPAGAFALRPDGSVLQPERHAVALVAAAAAAHAAGDERARDRLLDEAAAEDAANPTYFGAAWVALGRALLGTDLLATGEEPS